MGSPSVIYAGNNAIPKKVETIVILNIVTVLIVTLILNPPTKNLVAEVSDYYDLCVDLLETKMLL